MGWGWGYHSEGKHRHSFLAAARLCDLAVPDPEWTRPNRSAQLAEAIFGKRGYQQRVNQDCQLLVGRRAVERRGAGGSADPYKYYPAKA